MLYHPLIHSKIARRPSARLGHAQRSSSPVLIVAKDDSAAAFSQHWSLRPRTKGGAALLEETGLKVEQLSLWWRGLAPSAKFTGAVGQFWILYAVTDATDDDVVCGEGCGDATRRSCPAWSSAPRTRASCPASYRALVGYLAPVGVGVVSVESD